MKKFFTIFCALAVSAAGAFCVKSVIDKSRIDSFVKENIEALSQNEGSGTCCNQVGATCYVAGYPKQEGAYYSTSGPCQ